MVPLQEIREKMLKKSEKYLRIIDDEAYKTIDIASEYRRLNEEMDTIASQEEQIQHLKNLQRTRHLSCWHDGSGISNHGHLLITICTLYDEAIFYTDEEYFKLTGISCEIIPWHRP